MGRRSSRLRAGIALKSKIEEVSWYRASLRRLRQAKVPFLIGGAYAYWYYTGVRRPTKDLDLFLRPGHLAEALKVLRGPECKTEITAHHWLGKAFYKDYLIDFLIGFSNGLSQVDDSWFRFAVKGILFGETVQFVCPEDMIWSKAFVMERDRFDGADIAHILLSHGSVLNWERLLQRFASHESVLWTHLLLFAYIYPHAHSTVPAWVTQRLAEAVKRSRPENSASRLCRGTFFSRTQYVTDTEQNGYSDARLPPYGILTAEQILE